MKKNITLLFSAALALTAIESCDKVEFPYSGNTGGGGGGEQHIRRVLLEDFTGHRCTFCPEATRTAEKLIKDPPTEYGEKVVLMTVHAGAANNVNPLTSGSKFLSDFRTTQGNAIGTFFSVTFNPQGMVNRREYPLTTHLKPSTDWGTNIAAIINTPPDADLTITNTYNTGNKNLTCQIKSEFLTAKSNATYKLCAFLVQDSIIDWQTDFYANPNDQQFYVHMHVLRDNINGSAGSPWGDALVTAANVAAGDSLIKTYNYTLQSAYGLSNNVACVPKHCSVIAYIYDDDPSSPTYKEVIQAAEKKIQ